MSKDNNKNFSFLEFNELINKQFVFNNNANKSNVTENTKEIAKSKKNTNIESKNDKNSQLKFQPNLNINRIQIKNDIDESKPKLTANLEDIKKNFEGEQSLINKKEENNNNNTQKEKVSNQNNKKINKSNNKNTSDVNKVQIDEEVILTEEMINEKKKKIEQYQINNLIKNVKNNDPNAYLPILLPFDTHQKVNNDEENFNEDKLYLIQFPRQIPMEIESQEKTKMEETLNEEPSYDKNGYLIRPKFKNSFEELPNNTKLGKIKIYKSGKIKMEINNILFNVVNGIECKFFQEASVITNNPNTNNQAYILGNINSKKLIVVPEIK